jgi:peptidoglycan/xylan/chitin deacetylase (PgdA/CDA1 family)
MYHYVYDEEDPPADVNRRYGNYIGVRTLEEELNYLNENNYYFPTWEELRDYIDGKLLLPENSIILTFDDGETSFLKNGIPVLERNKVPATCFMITHNTGEKKIQKYPSDYVIYQSHSHDMHTGGGYIGKGGIITALSEEKILEDLKISTKICGSSDAFAYPYGDYNEASRDAVEKAGFLCAVTTVPGKVYPGDDPYLLKRARMVQGQSLQSFLYQIR